MYFLEFWNKTAEGKEVVLQAYMSEIKFSRDKSLVGTALLHKNNCDPKIRVFCRRCKT